MTEALTAVRREMADGFAVVRQEMGQHRGEVSQEIQSLRAELRLDIRHALTTMVALSGVTTAILIAFIEFRLAG